MINLQSILLMVNNHEWDQSRGVWWTGLPYSTRTNSDHDQLKTQSQSLWFIHCTLLLWFCSFNIMFHICNKGKERGVVVVGWYKSPSVHDNYCHHTTKESHLYYLLSCYSTKTYKIINGDDRTDMHTFMPSVLSHTFLGNTSKFFFRRGKAL